MRAAWPLVTLLVSALSAPAAAGDWTYSDPESAVARERWRYSARAGVWVGTFDRPQRACDPGRLTPGVGSFGVRRAGLRPAQIFDPFCPHDNSDEVGVTAGVDVSYRVFEPLHLTMGLDLVYTEPSSQILAHQVVVAVPFGVLVTWYDWVVRPILHLTVTPMVFITDVNRDYTLGGVLGVAYQIPDIGDISLTAGPAWSEHVDHVSVLFAFHPL